MTSLYETWGMSDSHNHHMYSDFMSWMMKTILGIRIRVQGYEVVDIEPHFFEGLTFARGHIDSPRGRISVDWKREEDGVHLQIVLPDSVDAIYAGKTLHGGMHAFVIGAS